MACVCWNTDLLGGLGDVNYSMQNCVYDCVYLYMSTDTL